MTPIEQKRAVLALAAAKAVMHQAYQIRDARIECWYRAQNFKDKMEQRQREKDAEAAG
jgi:hypothetical protein